MAHHPIAVARPHALPGLAIPFGVIGLVGAVVVHLQQFGAAAAWNHPGGDGGTGGVGRARWLVIGTAVAIVVPVGSWVAVVILLPAAVAVVVGHASCLPSITRSGVTKVKGSSPQT